VQLARHLTSFASIEVMSDTWFHIPMNSHVIHTMHVNEASTFATVNSLDMRSYNIQLSETSQVVV
jgi:hypothetical protein